MIPESPVQMSVKNYCVPGDWTVRELVAAITTDQQMKRSINIPRFQRGLVWDKKRQMALVNSIKMGHPIGTLLLHEGSKIRMNGGSKEMEIQTYALIDGLQRTNTLREYVLNPFQYFEFDKAEPHIKLSIQHIFDATCLDRSRRKEFDSWLSGWIAQITGMDERQGASGYRLCHMLKSKFSLDDVDNRIEEGCLDFIGRLRDEMDIRDYRIPVIVYKGPKADLFEIFRKVNDGGKKLSKYQLCAAIWADEKYDVQIENIEVRTKIMKRYERLANAKFIIEDFNPDNLNSENNIYEYVYGVGRVIEDRFPDLFRKSQEKTDFTNSTSFKFITIPFLADYDVNKTESFPEKLGPLLKAVGQSVFERAIIDALTKLSDALRPYISLKANQSGYNPAPQEIYHNDYQLVSLAGKIFVSKYDENLSIRDGWLENRATNPLLQRLPQYYIYDILDGRWQAHGNLTASQDMAKGSRYEHDITLGSWEGVLTKFYTDDVNKMTKNRAKIDSKKMLFLRYIYANTMTTVENQSQEFELEHLVPVKRLKEIMKRERLNGIQFDNIANLSLIPKDLNRDKKDLTIYEYYDEMVRIGTLTEEEARRKIAETERFSLTTRESLDFIGTELTRENYLHFLDNRFFELKKQFYTKNGILMDQAIIQRYRTLPKQ